MSHNFGSVWGLMAIPVMPQNFQECDREQAFLMPPDLCDWLPEDHRRGSFWPRLSGWVSAFFAAYRRDGWGRAAFEPSMMVSLLLYAYARGERSSLGGKNRAQVRGGCRLPGDRRSAETRSRDDRALPCAPRGRAG